MVRIIHPALFAAFVLCVALITPAAALDPTYDNAPPQDRVVASNTYTQAELVQAGHVFFGETSSALATMMQNILSRFGEPNGYILGEEASGAVFGGLRYGEGRLQTRIGEQAVYWQGPSFGWDLGGSGSRVMMLVYNLPEPSALMQRYTGVDGSAYLVGGLSMTVMAADHTYLIPVRTGVGARLGVSLGYLKFTERPTWNPF